MEPRRDGSDLGLPDGETPAALKALSSNDPILSTESSEPTRSATSSKGSRSCVATAAIAGYVFVSFLVGPGPRRALFFVFCGNFTLRSCGLASALLPPLLFKAQQYAPESSLTASGPAALCPRAVHTAFSVSTVIAS